MNATHSRKHTTDFIQSNQTTNRTKWKTCGNGLLQPSNKKRKRVKKSHIKPFFQKKNENSLEELMEKMRQREDDE